MNQYHERDGEEDIKQVERLVSKRYGQCGVKGGGGRTGQGKVEE